ncbi:MAG: sensor histidine kinase [Prolixibacteraceae bacterium]
MENKLLRGWQNEILKTGIEKNFWGIALFSCNKTLLFANALLKNLADDFSYRNLINPDFEKICQLPVNDSSSIFEGFLTIGDYSQVNISLPAMIFRKSDEILILTGYDYENLQQQNKKLHQLNREINNLQRQVINEKRNLENALHQLDEKNRELNKTNQQKDKLFSVIAHDLKSPFSGIIGFAEILKENLHELSAEQLADFTNHIYKSANNTYNLMENLLEWASIQRSTIKLKPETIHIYRLLEEVTEQVNDQALEKNISLALDIPYNQEWIADKNMLTGILRNLLTNAIKFSFQNNEVLVSVRQVQNELQFSVTDKGVGMSEEKTKMLFLNEPNESTRGTGDEKGSGLGLAICKDFVKLHGGTIWAESQARKGTTITFSLPSLG